MNQKLLLSFIFILCVKLSYSQIDKDTTFINGDLNVKFTATNPISFPPYYINQLEIDSISRNYNNSYLTALAIEKNQLDLLKPKVRIDKTDRFVILNNNQEIKLSPDSTSNEAEYTFDKIFKKQNQILFRVQWEEGGNYFLLNTLTGEKTYTIGRVFFSPNSKYLISINDDIEAGYSSNGFQLFSVDKNNNLKVIWSYEPDWGPEEIVWIDNGTLIIKGYYFYGENHEKKIFYKKLKIYVR